MIHQQSLSTQRLNGDNRKYETIRQLAKRHMMDQFHTTTDEELMNAVVELDLHTVREFEQQTTISKIFDKT